MYITIDDMEYDVDYVYVNGVPARMAYGDIMEPEESGYYDIGAIKKKTKKGKWKEIIPSDELIRKIEKELDNYL